MSFYTLAVSGTERVQAVHSEFAGRSTGDMLHIMFLAGLGVVVLLVVLVIANYFQRHAERNREAQHRVEVEMKLRHAANTRTRY